MKKIKVPVYPKPKPLFPPKERVFYTFPKKGKK